MAYAPGVERWMKCKNGIAFGFGDREVADILAEQEKRENFGCRNQLVVDSKKYQVLDTRDYKETYDVAVLHEHGGLNDDSVIQALSQSCLGCKFFKARY
jgi:hypothetical protein